MLAVFVGLAAAFARPQVARAATDAQQPQPAAKAAPAAIPAERQAARVAVIPITGPIDQVTLWSFERRLRAANDDRFDAVVLRIDTPGGEVEAMLNICLRIKSDAPANTVAWISPKAYSAGTIIALTCRELIVAPGSVFGDAAPISVMPGLGLQPLPTAERAKLESPILDELDAAAARRGDDPRLLQSFVVTAQELWLVERVSDGVRRFADRKEMELLGLEPLANVVVSKDTSAQGGAPKRPSTPTELPLSSADRGAWKLIESVDTDSRLLVVQSDEALRWGLAKDTVKDDAALKAFFGATSVVVFPESWAETLVRFLMSWPVRILLIGVLVVALVIEGMHPGVGIAGAIAACAILLLVGAPALIGLAEWWEILLVIAGIALIGAEVFVIPGTGIAGIIGAVCVLVGLVASFTGTDPTSAGERHALITASTTTVAGLMVGAILAWFASRWFRETALFKRAVLAASATGALEAPRRDAPKFPTVGMRCVADTDLRPSGRCTFGGELFDAQSTGEYIPRGTPVCVVGRMGSTLVVERVDGSEGSTT